jgi:two-component system phosphate regulon sensor histidine kinase PhoR
MRKRTFVWRLGVVLLLVQAVVGVVLATYVLMEVRGFHRRQSLSMLRRVSVLASDSIAAGLRAESEQALARAVGSVGLEASVRVTVIAPDGMVLADSDADAARMANLSDRREFRDAMASGSGTAQRRSHALQERMLYHAWLVRDENEEPLVVVRTAVPLALIDAQAADVLRAVLIAGGIWLGATLAGVVFFSSRLGAQVSRLGVSASRFARGDLDHRLPDPVGREFAELSSALNDMARQLSARIAQLDAERNQQEGILRSMEAGVIALDPDQRVIRVNRAAEAMLGLREHEARGRLLHEVVRQPSLHRFIADVLDEKTALTGEFELLGGEPLTLRATTSLLEDSRGRRIGLLVVLSDVTRLRRLESMRSDFAANVSHELRTPITNIKGYAETMLDAGTDDPEQTRAFLKIVARNANRLGAIIDDMLALTRLEQPDFRASVEMESQSIKSIIDMVVVAAKQEALDKEISIETEVPPDLEARVSPHLVEQAVLNLLTNAIRYSPARTRVRIVGAGEDGGEAVRIRVEDQGPGIEAQHLPRIFERFYRVDKARSREQGGTGLGLAIVKHIALIHGGRAEVESKPGRGSMFSIVLPRE